MIYHNLCYLCFTRILVTYLTFVRTLSSKCVHTFFVRTIVILLERYLVLHILCVRTLRNHFIKYNFVFRKGDVTVVVYCLLLTHYTVTTYWPTN